MAFNVTLAKLENKMENRKKKKRDRERERRKKKSIYIKIIQIIIRKEQNNGEDPSRCASRFSLFI